MNDALAKAARGNGTGAVKDLTRILDRQDVSGETRSSVLFNRGQIKKEMGDNRGAEQDFTASIETGGNDPGGRAYALFCRGLIRHEGERLEEARADYSAALGIADVADSIRTVYYASALLNRGYIKQATGDLAGGRCDFEAVLALDTMFASGEQKGKARVALAELDKANAQGGIVEGHTYVAFLEGADREVVAISGDKRRWLCKRLDNAQVLWFKPEQLRSTT